MTDTENIITKIKEISEPLKGVLNDRRNETQLNRNFTAYEEEAFEITDHISGNVHTVEKRFRALCQRYKQKKRIFATAASHYEKLHFLFFTIPLLLIQLTAALVPSILKQAGLEDLVQTVSTALAAATAILIATDHKLGWEKKSERFVVASSGYNSLQIKAANFCIMDCTDFGILEAFLSETGKVEDTVKESMPLVPEWIEKKILKSEQRRKELKKIDYKSLENI